VRKRINRRISGIALLLAGSAAPASAQRVLDLPMRAGAGADALAAGAIAVFWNPGSLGIPANRAEALIMDVEGPASTALDGIGLAGIYRLDERTAVAAGFQHVGVRDIEQTTTSPLPDDGAIPLDISENAFHFAAIRILRSGMGVGASVQYTRTADVLGGDDVVALGAGFRYALSAPLAPIVAASIRFDDSNTDWFLGAGVEHEVGSTGDWTAGGEYGLAGSGRYSGLAHRIAAMASWQHRVRVSAGIAGEPGVEGRTWDPVMGASVQLSRYVVSVMRENLANGIGAVHTFRFNIIF
jgi:hypothetical protein